MLTPVQYKNEMDIQIRPYKPGDTEQICELFTRCSPYLRDTAFWVWINRLLSSEDSIIAVAQKNDIIVGHYAIIPQIIHIDATPVSCGFGIHAIVDPQCRDAVSIFQISALAYKIAKAKGLAFVFGFPNANYRLIQQKIERWQQVALFNSYEIKTQELYIKTTSDLTVNLVTEIDYATIYRLNQLNENRNIARIELYRNLSYYINRYINHPQKLYKTYTVNSANNDIVGVFFCKEYTKDGLKYFHIVDYLYDQHAAFNNLLIAILSEFKDNYNTFSFWKGDAVFEQTIIDLGFKPIGFDTFLGVKILDKTVLTAEQLDELLCFDNWKLVMGDSDAF